MADLTAEQLIARAVAAGHLEPVDGDTYRITEAGRAWGMQALTDLAQTDPLIARLVACRQSLGLSVRAVAERAGVPSSQISVWERGVVMPSLANAARWAAALGLALTLTDASSTTDNGSDHAQHP